MTINCPYCNKQLNVTEIYSDFFCSFCGRHLSNATIKDQIDISSKEMKKQMIDLFMEKDYKNVLECSKKLLNLLPDDDEGTAFECAAKVMEAQRQYIISAKDLLSKLSGSTLKNVIGKYLFGSDSYDKDPIHKEYLDLINHHISVLSEVLAKMKDTNKYAVNIVVESLAEALLGIPLNIPDHTKLIFEADDIIFEKLIPYMSDDQLKKYFETYGNEDNRKKALPNQIKIMDTMKKEIVKRNINIDKETGRKKHNIWPFKR